MDILGIFMLLIVFWIPVLIIVLICVSIKNKIKAKSEDNFNLIKDILNEKNVKYETAKNIAVDLDDLKINVYVDNCNNKIAICNLYSSKNVNVIDFENIVKCEVVEDSNVISEGGVGRALVGGLVAGGVGAIVGASTRKSKNVVSSLYIKIITNDISNPLYEIKLITSRIDINSIYGENYYKKCLDFANNLYATIVSIINLNDKCNEKNDSTNENFVDGLEKLAKLKKDGLIDEEEFKKAKEKLLKTK